MKNVLNEINRIKNLMSITEQFEDENNDQVSGTVIIGDYFAELVSDSIQTIPNLVDDQMTINTLFKSLSSSEVYNNVNNLILSIGTVDFFKGIQTISPLCDLINEVFPNAELFVFKGVISDFDIESEEDKNAIEETGNIFYDEFDVCGFEIIGNDYSIISDVNVDYQNPSVQDLIEYADELMVGDVGFIDGELTSKKVISKRSISDEETDFDSIYEFLNQFEKIYKSGMSYDRNKKSEYKYDIEQIQIALNFLTRSDLEITGVYDSKTEKAVSKFQSKIGLEKTGICDTETLEEMFYELKIKGFDEEDLSKFIGFGEDLIQGILDISSAGLSSEQRQNVEILINKMEEAGITNPYTQVGILSVIGKESGFVPVDEDGYCGTDDSRIITIFGNTRGNKCKGKKCDDAEFFECVYGKDSGAKLGNTDTGDGYKYIGRGFNGLTGRANYRAYGYEGNPEDLNNVENAAEVAIEFLTKGGAPDFSNKREATEYFVNKNAGGSTRFTETLEKALNWSNKFDVR